MRFIDKFVLSLVLFFVPSAAFAGGPEIFPQNLSPDNVTVKFEVDSTWHLVEGAVKEVSGKVWLEEPGVLESLRADILFPVKGFDTDSSSRDERLREVMAADKYPNVKFEISSVTPVCKLAELEIGSQCESQMNGQLTVRGVTKELSVPILVEKTAESFSITGKTSIEWPDYEVEDPSILIAKLDTTVILSFEVSLEDKPSSDKQ